MSVEFLVKLRDSAQMLADAANEELEKRTPPEVKYDKEDFDKLFWEEVQGTKGPYQQTSKKANNNSEPFQALQTILKEHNGFVHIGPYKYWNHQDDPDTIDRRHK